MILAFRPQQGEIMETTQQIEVSDTPRDPVVDELTQAITRLEAAIEAWEQLGESADGSSQLETVGLCLAEVDRLEGALVDFGEAV
jgi:hypothetical protein